MAYDTSEERLKVRGSEQITRDLKVNRDAFVGGDLTVNNASLTTALDKLDGIESGAEVNVQADWNQTDTSADDYIKNKPNIPPTVIPDTAMSDTSSNPVENKVIKGYVDERHPDYVLGTEQDLHKKWIDGKEVYRKVTKILADGTVFSNADALHINQMLVFHGNLYATTNQGLYIVKSTGAEQIGFTNAACDALCIYNDKLYVGFTYGISVSTDGVTFVNNTSHPQKAVYTLAVFQNKLYAGGTGSSSYSSLYVSTDGESFSSVSVSSIGTSAIVASIVYKDKLYFGVLSKPMIVTSDGTTFTSYATTTNNTRAFCIYNNKLYAGKLVSEDGDTFTDSGLQATQTTVYGLSVYQGKLYAGVKNSGLYISDDGATFTLNSSMPTSEVCTSFIEHNSIFYIGGWTGLYYAILNLDTSNKSITLPIELKALLNMELLNSDFKINYTCIQIFINKLVIYLSSETISSLSPMTYMTAILEYTKS